MLAWGVHVTDSKVLGDLLHILEVEERVEAGFIYEIRMPVDQVSQLSLLPLRPARLTSLLSVPSPQQSTLRTAHALGLKMPKEDSRGGTSVTGGHCSQFHEMGSEQKASCGYLLGFLVVHKVISHSAVFYAPCPSTST